MLKRFALVALLALTALGMTSTVFADTDDGGGIVGTQSP